MGQLLDELGKLSKLQIVRLGCHHVGTLFARPYYLQRQVARLQTLTKAVLSCRGTGS